jgi:hypothetical protein
VTLREAKLLTGTILRMIYLGLHNLPFLNFSIWALQNGWRFYYKYSLCLSQLQLRAHRRDTAALHLRHQPHRRLLALQRNEHEAHLRPTLHRVLLRPHHPVAPALDTVRCDRCDSDLVSVRLRIHIIEVRVSIFTSLSPKLGDPYKWALEHCDHDEHRWLRGPLPCDQLWSSHRHLYHVLGRVH